MDILLFMFIIFVVVGESKLEPGKALLFVSAKIPFDVSFFFTSTTYCVSSEKEMQYLEKKATWRLIS